MKRCRDFFVLWFLLCACAGVRGDEGLWPAQGVPWKVLLERHGFEPSKAWWKRVQGAAVRLSGGGSGAFVSEAGLIVTSRGAVAEFLPGEEAVCAGSAEEERRCAGLEAAVPVSAEDVTVRVYAAAGPEATAWAAAAARRAAAERIGREEAAATGLECEVAAAHGGAQYQLFRYKRYADVRLVFAPERRAAQPGGGGYPRPGADFCLLRAYEGGRPARPAHFLRRGGQGTYDGDLVFAAGFPAATSRWLTAAELGYLRDVRLPWALEWFRAQEAQAGAYAERNAECALRAQGWLRTLADARRVCEAELAGLRDPMVPAARESEEARLGGVIAGRPELAEAAGAWGEIAGAQAVIAAHAARYNRLELLPERGSRLLAAARMLVRLGAERGKPDRERLPEYREANRAALEAELFSEEPVFADLEVVRLASYLAELAGRPGEEDALARAVMAGKTPLARAGELVAGTRLGAAGVRRELAAADAAGLARAAETDAMLGLARALDAEARAERRIWEEQGGRKRQAHAAIARVRFAVDGVRAYPDAEGSWRLGWGRVRGCAEGGVEVPAFTSFGELYALAGAKGAGAGREALVLPERWRERKGRVKGTAPLNFVSTCDVGGGCPGAAVVNRAGECVGVVLDVNAPAMAWEYAYSDVQGRAVAVDARAISEVLRKIYDADRLADEWEGKGGR